MKPLLLLLTLMTFAVQAGLITEERRYEVNGKTYRGYLALDDTAPAPLPGVLVVHEWWGHNDYVRERARMLAELGYAAFAIDMYGDGKTATHPDQAGAFAKASLASLPKAEQRFNAALALLAADSRVDGSRLAAIGYCYGGGVVLHMARAGAQLQAVASFHGSLAPKADPLPAHSPVAIAVFNGAADPLVPAEQVTAFREEMMNANADHLLVNYEGALHAFTNPDADRTAAEFGLPLAYNQAADRDSWQRLQTFLKEKLEPENESAQ